MYKGHIEGPFRGSWKTWCCLVSKQSMTDAKAAICTSTLNGVLATKKRSRVATLFKSFDATLSLVYSFCRWLIAFCGRSRSDCLKSRCLLPHTKCSVLCSYVLGRNESKHSKRPLVGLLDKTHNVWECLESNRRLDSTCWWGHNKQIMLNWLLYIYSTIDYLKLSLYWLLDLHGPTQLDHLRLRGGHFGDHVVWHGKSTRSDAVDDGRFTGIMGIRQHHQRYHIGRCWCLVYWWLLNFYFSFLL